MRRVRTLVPSLLTAGALLLGGCANVEVRPGTGPTLFEAVYTIPPADINALAEAPNCCTSPADFPYRDLDGNGRITIDFDTGWPAYAFDTGKSFFAAFRLPDGPRPLEVNLVSRLPRLTPTIRASRRVFNPAVAILDDQRRVRRLLHEPDAFTVWPVPGRTAEVEVHGTFHVDGTREESAYLAILTTDALRAREVDLGGVKLKGFSPVGTVDLDVRSAPFLAPPVTFRSAAARAGPGTPKTFFPDHKLFVDQRAVHYVEERDGRYTERLSIPFEEIVTVRFEARLFAGDELVLETAPTPDGKRERIGFELFLEPRQRLRDLPRAEKAIAAGIREGWYREGVAVEAADRVPEVVFRDPPRAASAADQRIVERAMTGGMLTAGVCGLCYGGVCPPEVLLSCAGLFAIGAAVGGIVGIGSELVADTPAAPPVPTLSAPQVEAARPAVRSRVDDVMAQTAVRACVVRRASGQPFWIAQGRAAALVPHRAQARFVLRTSVDRVALVGDAKPGQLAEAVPVQLVVEGEILLRDEMSGGEQRRPVAWRGASHPLAEWSAADGTVLETALKEACDGFAGAALGVAAPLWRAAP